MLFSAQYFYLNGESVAATGGSAKLLTTLADYRKLTSDDITQAGEIETTIIEQLHAWYLAGYLYFN